MLKFFKISVLFFLFLIYGLQMSANDHILMKLKDGDVLIELRSDLAPNHVNRISDLVKEGFYDGLAFHRVIPGFMAQGGDPLGNGTGGSGTNIAAEFSSENHVRGTVSMARAQDPNSADSQFFICFDGCGHLTGQYTVWGQVETGMEVVETLNVGEPPSDPDQIVSAKIIN